jgi:hypothetical protein
MATVTTASGLSKSEERRYHFDIYAVLEASQELYFGHETQVNVNVVETVRVKTDTGVLEKCYLSPTKRRGVERRSLIWAPANSDHVLLGDKLGCGIPHTCARPTCPICAVYGGLITGDIEVEVLGRNEKRTQNTLVGRLVHGGGVAIQDIEPSEKQRAMHPSAIHKGAKQTPMPFKREYNEPALLYPAYNHCLSVTGAEFTAVAYAFLDSLVRLGAGNPKGVHIYNSVLLEQNQPLLVLDRYLAPFGTRPVISPAEVSIERALAGFVTDALTVRGKTATMDTIAEKEGDALLFERWVGNAALSQLQIHAAKFAAKYLA